MAKVASTGALEKAIDLTCRLLFVCAFVSSTSPLSARTGSLRLCAICTRL